MPRRLETRGSFSPSVPEVIGVEGQGVRLVDATGAEREVEAGAGTGAGVFDGGRAREAALHIPLPNECYSDFFTCASYLN